MKKPKPCVTLWENIPDISEHSRNHVRKHSPAACVFYISLVSSNFCRVYHSVIHGLGFSICEVIRQKEQKKTYNSSGILNDGALNFYLQATLSWHILRNCWFKVKFKSALTIYFQWQTTQIRCCWKQRAGKGKYTKFNSAVRHFEDKNFSSSALLFLKISKADYTVWR